MEYKLTSIMEEFVINSNTASLIKVVGVGGGGSNAVSHMYKQNISDVSFVVCNTDVQALNSSAVPNKILLGQNTTNGLGAGNKPAVAREAAEESGEAIRNMFNDGTRMAFITAGMGGGTGTGAAPVIAKIARDMKILTIGIVTIPFQFEGKRKILQALRGIAELSNNVDALLVIHNDKLRTIYPKLDFSNAFSIANDVVTNAARGIAEIITIETVINVDFADVTTTLKDGGVAVMNTGYGEGDSRITAAIDDALNSPLLNNNDIHNSSKILLMLYGSEEHCITMEEIDQVHEFMKNMGDDIEVIWGIGYDNELGDKAKVILLAAGSGMSLVPDDLRGDMSRQMMEDIDIDVVPKTEEELDEVRTKWMEELYNGGERRSRVQISLDQIDYDDDKLREMESVPAYIRRGL